MKGGGSAPTQTTSTVTQNSLPEYARPWFENLLGRTAYESTRPYTPYPGQRMAYFDPYESMAQEGTAQMSMQGAPSQIGSATDITTQVGYQPTGQGMDIARQFRPPMQRTDYFGGSVANPYTVGSYMNPYQQYVTDIQKREAIRQSDIQGNQIAGQAAQAGGLGGYREAIMQSERQRNLNQQLGDMQAQGGLAGYQQAMQGIEADRRARMEEDTRRMQARQQNAALMEQRSRLGLAGLGQDMATRDQSLRAAGMLGDLGKADQAMAPRKAGSLGRRWRNQKRYAAKIARHRLRRLPASENVSLSATQYFQPDVAGTACYTRTNKKHLRWAFSSTTSIGCWYWWAWLV